ncbi:MAG TPA: phosphoribosyltransferase family protein [Terriglobia bacterium]|nr:phosphoribosyltransferase family protein [Terriglobia bacterium]
MLFRNRWDAGVQLGEALSRYRGQDVVVYALPRGGVVVGVEVARLLDAPLDLIIARKVGHPAQPEYAIGAVDADGHRVINESEAGAVDPQWFDREVDAERREAERRRDLYLGGRRPIPATGRVAIIVDDGLATGLTMQVAIKRVRAEKPRRLVVAVPVAPAESVATLESQADEVVALYTPDPFFAIGRFYDDFQQVSDAEVVGLLNVRPSRS